MESWRVVWRDGFCPSLADEHLSRLLKGLREDSAKLTQGSTTTPPPLMCVQDWPAEAADAIAFCCCEWGETTVGQAEEFFARLCFEADQRLGEPAACRWFLNWFDDTPRDEMRRELIAEVERETFRRFSQGANEHARTPLPEELTKALLADPGDYELRRAVSDYYRDHGNDEAADSILEGLPE
jgi:hypothetical protein